MRKFDLCEAFYLFYSSYHEGQWSDKYRKLCSLLRVFKPAPSFSYDSLSPEALEIYENLENREIKRLTANRWED